MGEEENTKNQGTDSYLSLLKEGEKRIESSPNPYTATAFLGYS